MPPARAMPEFDLVTGAKLEADRARRMKELEAKKAEMGIVKLSKGMFQPDVDTAFRQKKPRARADKPSLPMRASRRLQNAPPTHGELEDEDAAEVPGVKRTRLTADGLYSEAFNRERCSSGTGRGKIYGNQVGLTCHFCRQKVLCSEPDCPRCSQLDKEKECIGKTQCYGAGCAARREGRAGPNDGRYKCSLFETGVFCRACLSVRYGQAMEEVRALRGLWLCPHCYEDENPTDNWFCNSSLCMQGRGWQCTGQAIKRARAAGHSSVAALLQAERGGPAPAPSAASAVAESASGAGGPSPESSAAR